MAEETKVDPSEKQTGYVPATGAHGAHISDEDAAAAKAATASAEQLGVDQASFDKYYNRETADFNWQAYAKELEFKAQQGTKPAEEEPAKEEKPEETKEAEQVVADAGLNWDELGGKIGEKGTIDDADFEALAKIGIPKEIAQNYIDLVKGQADQLITDVHTDFGGEAEFNRVYDALQEVPEDKLNAIDDLLRDKSTRGAGVAAAYAAAGLEQPGAAPAANGSASTATAGNRGAQNAAPAQGDPKGYASFEDQVRAMRDPRYYSDPAYRDEVMRRTAASTYDYNPRQHTSGL